MYANRYFPYWKSLFLSYIFKKLLLRNRAVDFVEICNVCARRVIIKAAKKIINILIRCAVVIVILTLASLFLEHSV